MQPIVSSIFYFLSVLCIARYKTVLDSVERERVQLSLPRRPRSSTGSTGSQSPQLSLDVGKPPQDQFDSSPAPPLTPDAFRFTRSDSFDSSVASASDLRDPFNEKNSSFQFFGSEGVLHPPTVVPLTHAVDVSEQVWIHLHVLITYTYFILH